MNVHIHTIKYFVKVSLSKGMIKVFQLQKQSALVVQQLAIIISNNKAKYTKILGRDNLNWK